MSPQPAQQLLRLPALPVPTEPPRQKTEAPPPLPPEVGHAADPGLARADGPQLPAGVLMRTDVDHRPRHRAGECLHHLFEQRCDALLAQGRGAHLAVDSPEHRLSYPGLDALANQLARLLLAQGAGPGSVVGLLFDKTAWSYAALLAVGKIHAAYVPMDPGFPADRIGFIAQDSGVSWMLSTSPHQALAAAAGVPVLCLDSLREAIATLPPQRLASNECPGPVGELCYTIYTSGSTGRPKGVPIDQPSIVNFVRVAAEEYGYHGDDRVYQGLTLAFDFAVEEIWVPLAVGATLLPSTAGGSLLGQDLADFLRSQRITALCCVPTLLATLEEDLPDLRLMIVSGEACPRDLVQRWHRPGRRFLNAYGPTEATVTATLGQPAPGQPVTIGRPLPTYAIVVLPPDACRALPFGEEGEIGIAGIGIARGYLNRDDQTRRAFIADEIGVPHNSSGRIYRTGDLGRINDQGEVEYLGRIDTQVKIRGYRIELAEIESLLLQCPGVAQAAVNPWTSSPGVVELVAYYTTLPHGDAPQAEDLASALRERLPPYMVPAYFERLPAMPMLASDKTDRKALPAPSLGRLQASQRPFEAPATGLERDLAQHLAQLLGLPAVSATDHFFADLGMNSLLLARYSARLRQALDPDGLSMRLLYGHPTVRDLAAAMACLRPAAECADTGPTADAQAGTAMAEGGALDTSPATWPVHHATRSAYLACGAAQLVLGAGFIGLHGAAWSEGLHWVLAAPTWPQALWQGMAFAALYSVAFSLLPVVAKWLLVGRWQAERFPVWGLRYLRFWVLKALIRSAPVVVAAGTPLYVLYLRALGARVHPSALVALRQAPVCTDLLTVGPEAVLGHHTLVSGYRVLRGWVQTGPVQVGARAQVGEFALLDVHTALGEGAELAHSSSLQAGQRVPAGARWHGSPAQPAPDRPAATARQPAARPDASSADGRVAPQDTGEGGVPVSAWARTRYTLVQLLLAWGLALPLPAWLAFALWGEDGHALDDAGATVADLGRRAAQAADGPADAAGLLTWLAVAAVAYLGALVLGLLWVGTVPRWLAGLIRPGVRYPLYGWHFWLLRLVRGSSNVPMFNALFGDSGDIVHYLRAIGWRMPGLRQTGSNFGMAQQHDVPDRCTVGSGTMVSDGLIMLNTAYDARGFLVHELSLGEHCFLGNMVAVVPGHRVGDNCLLASKVMLPVDGQLRSNVGLLGSPAMEIPRASPQDADPVAGKPEGWLHERLRRKQHSNRAVMLAYLGANAVPLLLLAAAWHLLYPLGAAYEGLFAAGFAIVSLALTLLWMLLMDAVSRGFRPLQPQKCSIYEPYFWRHERHWKLGLANDNPLLAMLAGTPLRGWAWRAMGVQVGRQLFDDGCSITEKTLIRLGAHCTLGANSTLQGHSLEDGLFKSDRLWLGDGVTVGSQCYVHYATRLEDRALVLHDAFVMKGEHLQAGQLWVGNPAQCMAQPLVSAQAPRLPATQSSHATLVAEVGRQPVLAAAPWHAAR